MDIISVFETEVVGSTPAGPANKENAMKSVTLKNKMNGERFVCDDLRQVEVIDGVEFLVVHRPNEMRLFKIRKDILERVKEKIPQ
jgi:hypothetical protein